MTKGIVRRTEKNHCARQAEKSSDARGRKGHGQATLVDAASWIHPPPPDPVYMLLDWYISTRPHRIASAQLKSVLAASIESGRSASQRA